MWSRRAKVAAVAALALALGGCLQPLYAPPRAGGEPLAIRTVEVAPIPDRFGHFLRTELQFRLGGGALPEAPVYRLTVTTRATSRAAIVDRSTDRVDTLTLQVRANYVLRRIADNSTVASGAASATSTYDRSSQRFSNVAAGRSAEERTTRQLADQIMARVAAALAAE
jgi:LPS-assembly lipoprotein